MASSGALLRISTIETSRLDWSLVELIFENNRKHIMVSLGPILMLHWLGFVGKDLLHWIETGNQDTDIKEQTSSFVNYQSYRSLLIKLF